MHWFQSFFVMTWWERGTSFPLCLVNAAKKNRIYKLTIHRQKTITKHTSFFSKQFSGLLFLMCIGNKSPCFTCLYSLPLLFSYKSRPGSWNSFTTDSRLLPPRCSFHPTGRLLSFQPSLHQQSMRLCLASAQTSALSSSFSCALSSSYSPAVRQNT